MSSRSKSREVATNASSDVVVQMNLPQLTPQTAFAVLTLGVVAAIVVAAGPGAPVRAWTTLGEVGQRMYALYMLLTAVVASAVVWYMYENHSYLTGSHGMMAGMALGMMVGVMVGTLVGVTNGMFVGTVSAMLVAMVVGIVTGCCEGLMGIMEGLMAGVMGGMMGAMLGVMMIFDRVTQFIPFMFAVFVLGMALMVMTVWQVKAGTACCPPVKPAHPSWVARHSPGGLHAALPTGALISALIVVMGVGPRSSWAQALGVPAGAQTTSSPATGDTPAVAEGSPDQSAQGVPASVNGESISRDELDVRVRLNLAFLSMRGGSRDALDAQRQQIEASVLAQLVEEELLWQQVRDAAVQVSEPEVDQFVTSIASQVGATPEQVEAALAQEGLGLQDLREVGRRTLLIQKFIDTSLLAGAAPGTEQQVYEQWFQDLRGRAQIQTDPAYEVAALGSASGRSGGQAAAEQKDGYQEVNLVASAGGYSPNVISVKAGVPLRVNVTNDGTAGCSRALVFPEQNIYEFLPESGTKTIEFTPARTGQLSFSCGMGMFRGTLIVE